MPYIFIASIVVLGVLAVILALSDGGRHARYRSRARKVHKRFLRGDLTGGRAFAYLRKINPFVFEELVLDAFDANGFSVTRNKRYSSDGGIDGRVSIDGKNYLVQCKRYKTYIQLRHVEDFAALCEDVHQGGFFVHTGKTGPGSRGAQRGRVEIVSGEGLIRLLSSRKTPSIVIKQSK